jgi:hypothetical protein
MNTILFPQAYEILSECSEFHCTDCGWFGDKDHVNYNGKECPVCESTDIDHWDDTKTLCEDDVQVMINELLEQTIVFNQKNGYREMYNNDPDRRTYNAMFELDLHGYLVFRVLNWKTFRTEGSGYYVDLVAGTDPGLTTFNVNDIKKFKQADFIEMLSSFEELSVRIDQSSS